MAGRDGVSRMIAHGIVGASVILAIAVAVFLLIWGRGMHSMSVKGWLFLTGSFSLFALFSWSSSGWLWWGSFILSVFLGAAAMLEINSKR
jgi:hypothetical protein